MATVTDPWADVNSKLAEQTKQIAELTGIFERMNAQILAAAELLNYANQERLKAQIDRDKALQALEALRLELQSMPRG